LLTPDQIQYFRDHGFLAVEGVFSPEDMTEGREAVDELVEKSREVTEHDSLYDLEPGHSAEEPRVRRLKAPCAAHPVFQRLARHPDLLDIVACLIGPEIRLHGNKLNMKSAHYGSPVEWHQDFAFYPHTNDDLLAVGIALDDCLVENGCMVMIPGSHHGPILNHHQDGYFVGAVDPDHEGIHLSIAEPIPVCAGGITLHHCRTLHGSRANTSERSRRLFLLEMAAVDAWPVMGVADLDEFNSRILRGSPTSSYRIKEMDVRIPLPKHPRQGSIYEVQTPLRNRKFG
jgi:phytanoyl-CoA hydroxylase